MSKLISALRHLFKLDDEKDLVFECQKGDKIRVSPHANHYGVRATIIRFTAYKQNWYCTRMCNWYLVRFENGNVSEKPAEFLHSISDICGYLF